jgi:glycosyltransferase involved in cell wall biosynthesis
VSASVGAPDVLEAGLLVRLDRPLPSRITAARGNALFVAGHHGHGARPIESAALLANGREVPLLAAAMPRPDLAGSEAEGARGFWGIVPIPAGSEGALELQLRVGYAGGDSEVAQLATIEMAAALPAPERGSPAPASELAAIAICMATYEPEPALLRAQLDSIRAQTRRDWICVISDDCSSPEGFAAIEAEVAGDSRFRVSRSPERLGVYRNFERALAMAPPEPRLIAFADQDDVWREQKLERLAAAIGDAGLIYSDARIVDEGGGLIAPTYWTRRANNSTNLASLAIANTVTGAASLFKRELVELALPFPDAPGELFHDHWLALVALAGGSIRYLDEPLYDYVQHPRAALGHAVANALQPGETSRPGVIDGIRRRIRRELDWRELYFDQLCRIQLLATVLLLRRLPGDRRKRRTLARLANLERPSSAAWLALRSLRRLSGRNETLGLELGLLRGSAWRRLAARAGARPGRRQWQRGAAPT